VQTPVKDLADQGLGQRQVDKLVKRELRDNQTMLRPFSKCDKLSTRMQPKERDSVEGGYCEPAIEPPKSRVKRVETSEWRRLREM